MLAAAGPEAAAAVDAQLAASGAARLWLPARRSRADAFGPGTDLRGPLDLPVLIVAAADLGAADAAARRRPGRCRHRGAARPASVHGDAGAGRGRGRPRHRARAAHRRAAQPRHAQRPGHPGRSAHHGADARVQHLAVRSLDRRQEADHARTAPASPGSTGATPSSTRWRLAPGPGAPPASPPPARTTTTTCSRSPPACTPGRCPPAPSWPASSRPARCSPRSSRAATRSRPAASPIPRGRRHGATARRRRRRAGDGSGRPVHRAVGGQRDRPVRGRRGARRCPSPTPPPRSRSRALA